jgi:hypothetical protein
VTDIDKDGLKEILFPSYDGRVQCFSLDKKEHNKWPYPLHKSSDKVYSFGSPAEVLDLNGDGYKEIIFTSWTQKSASRGG